MPGNWPARFLGEGAAATSSPYPTLTRLSDGVHVAAVAVVGRRIAPASVCTPNPLNQA